MAPITAAHPCAALKTLQSQVGMQMMDDVIDIRDLYNAGWDVKDSRLERHQLERDITWLYFDKYLPSHGRILEVGAATGRHTLELARRGYTILAVDLAQDLVARAQKRAFDAGLGDQIEFRVDDARYLSGVPEREFDVVQWGRCITWFCGMTGSWL